VSKNLTDDATNSVTRKIGRKKPIVKAVLTLGIIILSTVGAFFIIQLATGTTHPVVVVTSGSMTPTLMKGDVVIARGITDFGNDVVAGPHSARNGSIIIFWAPWSDAGPDPIIHRVIGKEVDNVTGKYLFMTQGDDNWHPDMAKVPQDNVIGMFVARIPFIGYLKIWLTDTQLLIPLVIILAALLIISVVYDERKKIKDGAKRDESGEGTSSFENKPTVPGSSENEAAIVKDVVPSGV
jgi:signal peptidase I